MEFHQGTATSIKNDIRTLRRRNLCRVSCSTTLMCICCDFEIIVLYDQRGKELSIAENNDLEENYQNPEAIQK